MAPIRVILDSNVWRALIEADQVQDLRRVVKTKQVRVIVAPAVVYELLRTPGRALKRRLVKAATLGAWTRLMPDCQQEPKSAELSGSE